MKILYLLPIIIFFSCNSCNPITITEVNDITRNNTIHPSSKKIISENQKKYDELILKVEKLLEGDYTFDEMQVAKVYLESAKKLREDEKVLIGTKAIKIKDNCLALAKSSENLLKQDPNDKDFQERAKFYKELANLISDAP